MNRYLVIYDGGAKTVEAEDWCLYYGLFCFNACNDVIYSISPNVVISIEKLKND